MEKLTLKTGFDNSIESDSDADLELKLQMTSLITLFMENAIKTAVITMKLRLEIGSN